MRRIKLIVGVGVVMAAILALSAGPAMADEWDEWNDWNGHHGVDDGFNDVLLLDEGTAAFDQWCSPGLPDGIWLPGCIFSDVEEDEEEIVFIEDDDFFDDLDDEEVVFLFEVEEDDFFDLDDDNDRDHDGDHKRRNHRG